MRDYQDFKIKPFFHKINYKYDFIRPVRENGAVFYFSNM